MLPQIGIPALWDIFNQDCLEPTLGVEMVLNGGMENGNPPTNTANNNATTWEQSGVQKHSGSYSLHVVTGAGGGAGWILTGGASKVAGKKYKLSFWYWLVSGNLQVQFLKGDGSASIIIGSYSTTGSWQYAELIAIETVNGTYVAYPFGPAAAEFYIDDVSTKELIQK